MNIVTIWSTYGDYHLARVGALKSIFFEFTVVPLAHCSTDSDYKFFDLTNLDIKKINDINCNEVNFFKSFLRTFRSLEMLNPILILTCGYERPETFASIIYGILHRKKVFLMMENKIDDRKRNTFTEFVKKIYLKFFHGYIYSGIPHLEYLKFLGVPQDLCISGYSCVDNDRIKREVLTMKTTGNCPVNFDKYFLCISRFIPKKNFTGLIHAYKKYLDNSLRAEKVSWGLVLCGDGPVLPEAKRLVGELDLENHVYFSGELLSLDSTIPYYSFASAFILASNQNEQWGLVVNEAMASELPVFVSIQSGCAQDLVRSGYNGFLFNGDDVDELASLMAWASNNELGLKEMGKASGQVIDSFSPEMFATKVKNLFNKIYNY